MGAGECVIDIKIEYIGFAIKGSMKLIDYDLPSRSTKISSKQKCCSLLCFAFKLNAILPNLGR